MTDVTDDSLTIDELARRVGMTARNVRAHQSRGLLPPPHLRGRTGYYGPEHVARLELIRDLQAEGFNLEAIRRLLDRAPGGSASEALDFTRALVEPFGDELPAVVEAERLQEVWGDELTPELVERIEKLGFARDLGDGRWEVRSPRLQRASEELSELGIPLEEAVEVTSKLKRHAQAVATVYVQLFLEQIWRPFVESGEPPERWAEAREALERLRPLAGESLLAVFGIVMTEAVEQAFERELERMES